MRIKDLEFEVPVVQGGMGIGVSLSSLAGNVSLNGGLGVISAAQIGYRDKMHKSKPIETNLKVLKDEIKKAKHISKGKPIGVNIMMVTRRYEDYVKACIEAGADIIISGAGLPMDLPLYAKDARIKLAPIVSSKRALMVILRYWKKHYQLKPDLVVIEGPTAGGHLGFSKEELACLTKEEYDEQIKDMIAVTKEEEIPVVVAGGIYQREDMLHYLAMGAGGVQLATRFVTTYECDASEAFKNAYIQAKKEDIMIVNSPVGMPGRAIHNAFLERVKRGERFFAGCRQCITTCDPCTTPYCITQALMNAVMGRIDEGLLFCGQNAYRATKLEHVADILKEFEL